MNHDTRRTATDRGDTLIEILLALIIISIAAVALLASFATTTSASATYRTIANSDAAVQVAAETARYDIEQLILGAPVDSSPLAVYAAANSDTVTLAAVTPVTLGCNGGNVMNPADPSTADQFQSGVSDSRITVVQVEYWSASPTGATPGFAADCPSSSASVLPPMEVVLQITINHTNFYRTVTVTAP
jgi:prepilin-type N-terminal cleavage/methylation domain-containing protein